MTRISNSKLDLYQLCPKKFYFKYIEKLKADVTRTPLLFGTAMDAALNYILECIKDKKEWCQGKAKDIFVTEMHKWDGQNTLDFFKNEVPEELQDSIDPDNKEHQEVVFDNIVQRGLACIDIYITNILPEIEEVIEVQKRGELSNEEGDIFEFVVDAVVKLKDGRTVLLDNKTASAKYKKKAVIESQQLSLYLENYPDIKFAAYAVLIKNPAKEKGLTHQLIVDEVPEETKQKSFNLLEQTLLKIKNKEFPCNYKSCKAFGKPCEYERACSFGDYSGLIKAYKEDKKEE
jgi:hypothetical protein